MLTLSTPALRMKLPFLFHFRAKMGPLCWPSVLARFPVVKHQRGADLQHQHINSQRSATTGGEAVKGSWRWQQLKPQSYPTNGCGKVISALPQPPRKQLHFITWSNISDFRRNTISHHLLSIFWQSHRKSLLLAVCLHSVQNTDKCVRMCVSL